MPTAWKSSTAQFCCSTSGCSLTDGSFPELALSGRPLYEAERQPLTQNITSNPSLSRIIGLDTRLACYFHPEKIVALVRT